MNAFVDISRTHEEKEMTCPHCNSGRQEIKVIAKRKGIKAINMKKSDLIRTIQKAEDNSDCFGSTKANKCKEMNCLWREDCITAS